MKRLAALHAWPAFSSRAATAASTTPSRSSVREQDEGIGAAELEHDLLEVAPGDLGDGGAGALGAGDGDALDPRVGDDVRDLVVGGVDVDVGAVGEAGVVEDPLDRLSRLRALRRMLQQDRVAETRFGSGEARHLVVRVVPGHDPEQDADGAAADERRALAADSAIGSSASRLAVVA